MDDTKRAAVQENTILRLRLEISELLRKNARLEADQRRDRNMIDKLRSRIRKLEKDPAIALFQRGAGE